MVNDEDQGSVREDLLIGGVGYACAYDKCNNNRDAWGSVMQLHLFLWYETAVTIHLNSHKNPHEN